MERLQKLSESLGAKSPLLQYRKKCTVVADDFKEVMFGPNWNWRDLGFRYIKKLLQKHQHYHLTQASRKQMRLHSAKLMLHYSTDKFIDYDDYKKNPNSMTAFGNAVFSYSPGFSVKNGVHLVLYLKTVSILGTERHQDFIRRCIDYKDIGCFALTEATHGSNVKGILTQAHYDHESKEFIIHSPCREAMKFWIGAASNLANIAAVWAQLYIGEKCYGVHVFLVPLRSTVTHDLMPGVLIGDCGPKNGNNQIDNGFILFDRVRIPAANLLNKLSGVDQKGKFYNTLESEEKRFGIQLGALSGGRVNLCYNTPTTAINALAIAVRYACNRRQFTAPGSKQQTIVFDYPLTQYRLMPLLAQSLVYLAGGSQLAKKFDDNTEYLLDPRNSLIEQIHALSSVLKPKSTWFVAKVISECRQMLGGHGYSAYSRLGAMYNDHDINQTWEGDNNILLQQTTKFILESSQALAKGKPVELESLKFFNDPPVPGKITAQKINCLNYLENLLKARLWAKLEETGFKMLELKTEGLKIFDIWNGSQVYFGRNLALIYGDLYYLQAGKRALSSFRNTSNKNAFANALLLWALNTLEQEKYGEEDERKLIRNRILQLCTALAKEAVGILDILAAPSEIIGSPFADEKGEGMKQYLNLLFTAKDTFKKVDWYELVTDRNRD